MANEGRRFVFTMKKIADLSPPRDGRQYVYDAKVGGLALCVTATGSRSFYWLKKVNGRTERFRLGGFPEITVGTARDLAMKYNAEKAAGLNPGALKRKRKGEATFRDLFDHFKQSRIDAGKRQQTVYEYERLFNRELKAFHNRPLSAITRDDVKKHHAAMRRENGLYVANRMLALVRAMYNTAGDVGYEGINPTQGIKKFPEVSRERYLLRDEVPAFFEALAKENELFRDYFTICLLTGARRSNVCAMAWADISLLMATWRIPGAVSKNGQQMVIPLVPQAVEILQRRYADNEAAKEPSPWVFPGGKKNRAGHLQDPKGAWERIRENSGLHDLRIHDLRRTLGSWQAEAGTSQLIIGASLGHRSIQSTAVYARIGSEDVVRNSVTAAGEALLAAATVKPPKAIDDEPLGIG